MDTVSPVSALQNYRTVEPDFQIQEPGSQGVLSQDDFFKLLTVQLTSQDPLKPMEDTEFISQMTSFSTLSEMESIAADMKMMREQQEVFTTQSLIGKLVRAQTGTGEIIEGLVTRVAREEGELVPYVGDRMVDNTQITEIFTARSLVGKLVEFSNDAGEPAEGVVTHVAHESGELVPYIGEQRVDSARITKISDSPGTSSPGDFEGEPEGTPRTETPKQPE